MEENQENQENQENPESEENSYKSRRKDRAKRRDVYQEWQSGTLDEEYRIKERWSREAKKPKQKVQKQQELLTAERQEVLVVEVHRRTSVVRAASGEFFKCWYAANLNLREYGRLAPGDRVTIAQDVDGDTFYIIDLLERTTKLSRPGPRDRINSELVLASNIDKVLIVCSGVPDQFNPGFLDRYLLVCAYSELDMILVINKKDLYGELTPELLEYSELAQKTILTSAQSGEGIEELRTEMANGLSVLTGQSGVGKSTLIQALIPNLDLKTKEVRESDGKGKHATTVSTLYSLSEDAMVIDTPGIRELGLWKIEPESVAHYFPGFESLIGECRFSNCQHQREPGCAIIQAVEEGVISENRYSNYLRIVGSIS
ncbi:MAG: ribosome small subunit-dependent GTPase A [Fibrobacterales bacterium]